MNKRLRWFVKEMQGKLRMNQHKTDSREEYVGELINNLDLEVAEMKCACRKSGGGHDDEIVAECADVANYAMMLADKVYHQKKKGSK